MSRLRFISLHLLLLGSAAATVAIQILAPPFTFGESPLPQWGWPLYVACAVTSLTAMCLGVYLLMHSFKKRNLQ